MKPADPITNVKHRTMAPVTARVAPPNTYQPNLRSTHALSLSGSAVAHHPGIPR